MQSYDLYASIQQRLHAHNAVDVAECSKRVAVYLSLRLALSRWFGVPAPPASDAKAFVRLNKKQPTLCNAAKSRQTPRSFYTIFHALSNATLKLHNFSWRLPQVHG
jgi:hypothetical protein